MKQLPSTAASICPGKPRMRRRLQDQRSESWLIARDVNAVQMTRLTGARREIAIGTSNSKAATQIIDLLL